MISSSVECFVISLDRSEERYCKVASALQRAHVNVERFSAVDGSKLSQSDLIKARDEGILGGRFYNDPVFSRKPGTAGCALSHVYLWRYLSNIGFTGSALIFEDDVIVPRAFKRDLQPVVSELPSDFDIFFLAGWSDDRSMEVGQKRYSQSLFQLTRPCYHTTAAYIINMDRIDHIQATLLPILTDIDIHITNLRDRLAVYLPAIRPPLCICQAFNNSVRQAIDKEANSNADAN